MRVRPILTGYVLLSAGILAGCVNPSAKIATELTRYGLQPTQAQCVGDRLEAKLSISQLQELAGAARAYGTGDTTPGRLTTSDLIRVSAQIRDPRIPLEVARAASACGVAG
jgi:hypothetical protein